MLHDDTIYGHCGILPDCGDWNMTLNELLFAMDKMQNDHEAADKIQICERNGEWETYVELDTASCFLTDEIRSKEIDCLAVEDGIIRVDLKWE